MMLRSMICKLRPHSRINPVAGARRMEIRNASNEAMAFHDCTLPCQQEIRALNET